MTFLERRRLWVYGLSLVVLTTIPYLIAFAQQDGGWEFTGSLIGVQDGNSYVAKMLRGQRGDWLFRTPYTTIEQKGAPVFLPYLLLGKLAAGQALHLQLVVLFHLFRVAGVLFAVTATYSFLALYLQDPADRLWGTVLATAGAGLGWILPLLGQTPGWPGLPLAFISPETFGFLGSYAVPHLAMARGCLLLALVAYLRSLQEGGRGWIAPLLALVTFLLNPIAGAVGVIVVVAHRWAQLGAASRTGGWAGWRRGTGLAIWTFSLSAPYVLYLMLGYARDPFLRGWAEQNQILSPHAGYYLLAYGLLVVPALLGARELVRSRSKIALFPVVWLALLPALAYAPVGVQRRLTEGGWVALVLLSSLALASLRRSSRPRRWAQVGLLALSLPSSLLIVAGGIRRAQKPAWPAFVPSDQVAAFRFLAENAADEAVVLAGIETSNALPAWAPVRVPIGHGPESIDLEDHQRDVERFFAPISMEERQSILERYTADWFLVGPTERRLGWQARSGGGTPWSLAAEWDQYAVYRVGAAP